MCIFLSYYISLLCKVVNTTLYHDLFSFRKKLIARAAFLRHVISMQFFPLCARNNSKYRIITNFLTIRYLMMRLRLQVLLSRSITYIFPFFSIANIIMPVTQWNLTIYRVLVSPFSLFRFVSAILHPCLC